MIALTPRQIIWSVVIALVLAMGGWLQFKGKFWAWRADVWKERATEAAAAATLHRELAARHEAARANTNVTRARTDLAVGAIQQDAEHDAQEIEREQENPPALGAAPASDVERMGRLRRAYEEDTAPYRAARDRLQRARAGRAGGAAADR